MKQQDVFKKIGVIIKELNDQYNYLVENQEELNDLELELFVANAHFLADHSEVLRKLSASKPEPPKPAPVSEPRFFEPVVQQAPPPSPVEVIPVKQERADTPVPHIDLRGDDTGTDYSYIRQEPEVIRHELNLDNIPDQEEEPVAEIVQRPIEVPQYEAAKIEAMQPPIQEPIKTEARIADEKEELLTINQRISAQLNATASRNAEHVSAQPISDLKQAITLNDKLLYIKDLFNGYNLAYSEAIDILNRFNSFDEADNFLKTSYAVKNHWESKETTVEKFYNLLRRRYS